MKKLYHKGTVHPSPPIISDHLAFLPAAILTLATALSPDDREVLSYLISCSSAAASSTFSANPRRKSAAETAHSPAFNCSCFGCYTSYWVRWDESPNRQLIHEIIDAYEDSLAQIGNKGKKNGKGKKEKRNQRKAGSSSSSSSKHAHSSELKRSELVSLASLATHDSAELEAVVEGNGGGDEGCEGVAVEEKGSVRRFVSFIGERIWGGWGQ
ncbi:uncharacterized protein LOC124832987 [Vigna umbellata]|uniref:uncharacterized protein LOC124832987 n=1 Tax=Vigna umbellata TaxID=87088 RepID=UPI001F5F03F9|nr:uncharacterized protein LOC124832987 [Vigna umbellata]